jgi:DNA-binding transcriptional regulator LsrR (DeoR family)
MTTLTSIEERELLQAQRSFMTVKTLAEQAKATLVGLAKLTGMHRYIKTD